MNRIGIFLKKELMMDFPDTVVGALDALEYARECTSETGILHEVVLYEEQEKAKTNWTEIF